MADRIEDRARFDLVRYANVWEDAEVLVAALRRPGRRILSIASAGDNAFALLAAGAEVVAADLSAGPARPGRAQAGRHPAARAEELLAFLGAEPTRARTGGRSTSGWSGTCRRRRGTSGASAWTTWPAASSTTASSRATSGSSASASSPSSTGGRPSSPCSTRAGPGRPRRRSTRDLGQPALAAPLPGLLQPLRHGPPGAGSGVLPLRRRLGRRAHPGAGGVCPDRAARPRQSLRRIHPDRQLPPAPSPSICRPEVFAGAAAQPRPADPFRGPDRRGGRASTGAPGFDGYNLSDIFEYLDPETSAAVYGRLLDAARPGARFAYWNMLVPRRLAGDAARARPPAGRRGARAVRPRPGLLLQRLRAGGSAI